jgi:hypothetical protein
MQRMGIRAVSLGALGRSGLLLIFYRTLKGGQLKSEKSYMCMKMTNLLTLRSLACGAIRLYL